MSDLIQTCSEHVVTNTGDLTPTKRDVKLLRALSRGDQPRGSSNDVSRLNKILPEMIVNRAHPIHESPYLFLEQMGGASHDPDDVLRNFIAAADKEEHR